MKHTLIQPNFIYPEIKEADYIFGSQEVVGTILRPDGDWRSYIPPEEVQSKNGVESSACFLEGQQHTIATVQAEQFGITGQNYAARFNIQFSGATSNGGDPLKGATSIRNDGLIPDSMLPFTDDIHSWEEFASFKGGSEHLCRTAGKLWLEKWEPNYDIVIKREFSLTDKYTRLRDALKHSPIPLSVFAWVEDENGIYIKPEGSTDNHLVECVYLDDQNCAYIWDTYPPFLKKLGPNYNFDFAMRWSLKEKSMPVKTSSFLGTLLGAIRSLFTRTCQVIS